MKATLAYLLIGSIIVPAGSWRLRLPNCHFKAGLQNLKWPIRGQKNQHARYTLFFIAFARAIH
jgi:hypothetical protein